MSDSILYSDRYRLSPRLYLHPSSAVGGGGSAGEGDHHMTKPFKISRQEYYASPLTKTGRHLKDDKNRAEVARDYLSGYYQINQLMVDNHIALGLPLNPVPPPSSSSMGWMMMAGRGSPGGHSGNTFQDCGKPSINWYNGKILDTGNPQANYFATAPGSFNRMGPIYASNNVTIVNGVTSVIPAQNGVATGQPQSATQCNSQWMGFDYGGFYGSQSGYYWWNWYLLHPFIPAIDFATDYVLGGFARGSGGQGGQGGLCPDNMRLIRAQIQQGGEWKDFMCCVDTGTPSAMLGGLLGDGGGGRGGPMSMMMGGRGGGSRTIQMKFAPNPNPIAVPYNSKNQGANFVPAYYISKRVDVCLTNQYTIVRSGGKAISYNCSSGQITNSDALGGKEWSNHPLQAEVPSLSPQFNPSTSNTRTGGGHSNGFYDASSYYY